MLSITLFNRNTSPAHFMIRVRGESEFSSNIAPKERHRNSKSELTRKTTFNTTAMDGDELEAIRKARMAELQKSQGGQGQGMSQMGQQQRPQGGEEDGRVAVVSIIGDWFRANSVLTWHL